VLFERPGKSRRRLIAYAGCNPGDGVVARFEHECGLIHPTRDEVTVHWLADEPGKASREGRAAEPHLTPKCAKGPAVRVDCDEVLHRYQQNGKTVAIRQFKGRTPPPSTRFRAFLADGVATTGALASGFG
jgi:hypothetical protein